MNTNVLTGDEISFTVKEIVPTPELSNDAIETETKNE